jgi:hypothetical protein
MSADDTTPAGAERLPEINITPVEHAEMTITVDGYGPGLLWTSHLRVGRCEVTHWYEPRKGGLKEINESTVTRTVAILGKECFEVRIRGKEPNDVEWTSEDFEYFYVDDDGTHWIRLKDDHPADFAKDDSWEIQDDDEGVSPRVLTTERPEASSKLEVVNLTMGGDTQRCLRQMFYEKEPGWEATGGDLYRREDGTPILYYRLLGESARGFDLLPGMPEYSMDGTRFRVWETVLLVKETG